MTVFNGKRITQRGGMGGEYGKVYGLTAAYAKQIRDTFLATKPEPYLAELHGETPSLGGGSFREDRIS